MYKQQNEPEWFNIDKQKIIVIIVPDIKNIHAFYDSFEKIIANLTKEKLYVAGNIYATMIKDILLWGIRITAFDNRYDKPFERGDNIFPQETIKDLTNFHNTQTTKEDIYKQIITKVLILYIINLKLELHRKKMTHQVFFFKANL